MYAITVITQWTIQNGVLTNRLNSFMGGTQYFLKKYGTEVIDIPYIGTKTVEIFWIIKGSENNNVVQLGILLPQQLKYFNIVMTKCG